MFAVLNLINTVLTLYIYVIFAMVVMSWLFAFNVINPRNQFVAAVDRVVNGLTEPLLAPIRRFMPNLGGIDISPILLLLAIFFLRDFISKDLPRYLM
ncbi:YggT family protein [Pseudahrensia aquimaris]|uniref:YggT family protein n=1 Tax=Pseudahrensia aquimaris TaxID=744461 RepID=A0ABW3FFJ8_9HYPH